MPAGIPIPQYVWDQARAAVEKGGTYSECAKALQINANTLRCKANKEKWRNPHGRARDMALPDGYVPAHLPDKSPPADNLTTPSPDLPALAESLEAHRDALAKAAIDGPDAFKSAIKQVTRDRLAMSVASLPLPRTIGEWKQMVEILNAMDKATGPGQGNAGRHVTRLARAPIDVEPIPECDGFRI